MNIVPSSKNRLDVLNVEVPESIGSVGVYAFSFL